MAISKTEPVIHFQPTLSACFSASLDQEEVPKRVSPTLETVGVEDREIPTPTISPTPPSKKRSRTRVEIGMDIRARSSTRESPRATSRAARNGLARYLRASRNLFRTELMAWILDSPLFSAWPLKGRPFL